MTIRAITKEGLYKMKEDCDENSGVGFFWVDNMISRLANHNDLLLDKSTTERQ